MIGFMHSNNENPETQQHRSDATDMSSCSSGQANTVPSQQVFRADNLVTHDQWSLSMKAHERELVTENKSSRDNNAQLLAFNQMLPMVPNSQPLLHSKQTFLQYPQQPYSINPAPAVMLDSASTSAHFANMNTVQLPYKCEPDRRTQLLLPLQNHVYSSHSNPQTPHLHCHNHYRSLSDSGISCTMPPLYTSGQSCMLGGVLASPSHLNSYNAMDTLRSLRNTALMHAATLDNTQHAQRHNPYLQPSPASLQSFNTTTLQTASFIPPYINIYSLDDISKDYYHISPAEPGHTTGRHLEAVKERSNFIAAGVAPSLIPRKNVLEPTVHTPRAGSKRKPAHAKTLIVQRWRPDDGSRSSRQHTTVRKGTSRAAATRKSRMTTVLEAAAHSMSCRNNGAINHRKARSSSAASELDSFDSSISCSTESTSPQSRKTENSHDSQFAACTSIFWAISPDSILCPSKLYDASPTLSLPVYGNRLCDEAGVPIHRHPQAMHASPGLATFPLPSGSMTPLSSMTYGSFQSQSAPVATCGQPYEQYGGSVASSLTPPAAWPLIRISTPPEYPALNGAPSASSTLVASPHLRGCGQPTQQQRLHDHPVALTTMAIGTPHLSAATPATRPDSTGLSCPSNGADGETNSSSDGSGSSTPVPKQPCNSFMLYRKSKLGSPSLLHFSNLSSDQISIEIGELWNSESDEVKLQYKRQADMERMAFVQDFPNYSYKRSKSPKKGQDLEEEISRPEELSTVEGRRGVLLEEEARSKE